MDYGLLFGVRSLESQCSCTVSDFSELLWVSVSEWVSIRALYSVLWQKQQLTSWRLAALWCWEKITTEPQSRDEQSNRESVTSQEFHNHLLSSLVAAVFLIHDDFSVDRWCELLVATFQKTILVEVEATALKHLIRLLWPWIKPKSKLLYVELSIGVGLRMRKSLLLGHMPCHHVMCSFPFPLQSGFRNGIWMDFFLWSQLQDQVL